MVEAPAGDRGGVRAVSTVTELTRAKGQGQLGAAETLKRRRGPEIKALTSVK